jgi:hypothetical protein
MFLGQQVALLLVNREREVNDGGKWLFAEERGHWSQVHAFVFMQRATAPLLTALREIIKQSNE